MESSTSKHFTAFLAIFSFVAQVTLAIERPTTTNAYTNFIKSSCKATTYPNLCYNSLSTHAKAIQTSPILLVNAALSVTLDTTRTTSAMMTRMSKGAMTLPRDKGAMRNCLEVLKDAIRELQSSIKEIGQMKGISKNFGLMMNNVQTWVSAVLTDEDPCMEGFGGKAMDGKLKTIVRAKIMNICHLTRNSLALINSFAELHG